MPAVATQPHKPTFQVVTEVDLIPQGIAKNDSHKLFIPCPLHILPAVAVCVAGIMLEGKWDPDGLATLTTQNTPSVLWWLTALFFSHKVLGSWNDSLGLPLFTGLL